MIRLWPWALSLGVAILCGRPARGAQVIARELTCPIDSVRFTAEFVFRYDLKHPPRIESDLFTLDISPALVLDALWTCPRCRYSGFLRDFTLGEEERETLREKVLQELPPVATTPAQAAPQEIPVPARAALAARIYEWRGKSPWQIGFLHLLSAWALRLGEPPPLSGEKERGDLVRSLRRERPRGEGETPGAYDEALALLLEERALADGTAPGFRGWALLQAVLLYRQVGLSARALDALEGAIQSERGLAAGGAELDRLREDLQRMAGEQRAAAVLFARDAGEVPAAAAKRDCYLARELRRRAGGEEGTSHGGCGGEVAATEEERQAWAEALRDALLMGP